MVKKSATFCTAAILLAVLICLCFLAPLLMPNDEIAQNAQRILLAPNWQNWLGTDNLGRDLLARLLFGGRISMTIAVVSSTMAVFFGLVYGGVSGWCGGVLDRVMMKFLEMIIAIPNVIFMILLSVVLQDSAIFRGLPARDDLSLMFALSAFSWMSSARLTRGMVMQLREKMYVEAARALGASPWQIARAHLLRNMWGPILNLWAFYIPGQILFESFLSFIGLGVQAPHSSWGVLISEGWKSMRYHPHLIIFPTIALSIATISLNLISDELAPQV